MEVAKIIEVRSWWGTHYTEGDPALTIEWLWDSSTSQGYTPPLWAATDWSTREGPAAQRRYEAHLRARGY